MEFDKIHGDEGTYWHAPSCDIAVWQADAGGPFVLCYAPQWRDAMVELGEDASAHLSDDRPGLTIEHDTLEGAMAALLGSFNVEPA